MTFQYVSVQEAIARSGLRMVVVGDVPSPWGEAAKGIFHIKGLDWVAVRLAYDDDALKDWAGQRSGPDTCRCVCRQSLRRKARSPGGT